MKILLENDISDFIAIICTHVEKQWFGPVQIHLKIVQEDGVQILQEL